MREDRGRHVSDQENNGIRDSHHVDSLVERLRSGEPDATAVVRQRVQRILAFRGFRIGHEDRLDLEQVVMTQIWQAVARPAFDPLGFWGFVEVVVARRCVDWIRAHRPVTDLDSLPAIVDPRENPLRDVLGRERQMLAAEALERLPEGCRELVELHAAGRRTYAEMAKILGRSEGALRVQMHRCIQRASRELKTLLRERSQGDHRRKV